MYEATHTGYSSTDGRQDLSQMIPVQDHNNDNLDLQSDNDTTILIHDDEQFNSDKNCKHCHDKQSSISHPKSTNHIDSENNQNAASTIALEQQQDHNTSSTQNENTTVDEFKSIPNALTLTSSRSLHVLSPLPPSKTSLFHSSKRESPRSISFEGCGSALSYHIGVYKALRKVYGIPYMKNNMKYMGTSSGSLVALMAACGVCPERMKHLIIKFIGELRCGALCQADAIVDNIIDEIFLNNPYAYLKLNKRLYVSVTKFFMHNYIVSEWKSNFHVRQVIGASCFIPLASKVPVIIGGFFTIDGGFSFNHPRIDEDTILVSPSRNVTADIMPKATTRFSDAIGIPTTERINDLMTVGFCDGIKYFTPHKAYSAHIAPLKQTSCGKFYYWLTTQNWFLCLRLSTNKLLTRVSLPLERAEEKIYREPRIKLKDPTAAKTRREQRNPNSFSIHLERLSYAFNLKSGFKDLEMDLLTQKASAKAPNLDEDDIHSIDSTCSQDKTPTKQFLKRRRNGKRLQENESDTSSIDSENSTLSLSSSSMSSAHRLLKPNIFSPRSDLERGDGVKMVNNEVKVVDHGVNMARKEAGTLEENYHQEESTCTCAEPSIFSLCGYDALYLVEFIYFVFHMTIITASFNIPAVLTYNVYGNLSETTLLRFTTYNRAGSNYGNVVYLIACYVTSLSGYYFVKRLLHRWLSIRKHYLESLPLPVLHIEDTPVNERTVLSIINLFERYYGSADPVREIAVVCNPSTKVSKLLRALYETRTSLEYAINRYKLTGTRLKISLKDHLLLTKGLRAEHRYEANDVENIDAMSLESVDEDGIPGINNNDEEDNELRIHGILTTEFKELQGLELRQKERALLQLERKEQKRRKKRRSSQLSVGTLTVMGLESTIHTVHEKRVSAMILDLRQAIAQIRQGGIDAIKFYREKMKNLNIELNNIWNTVKELRKVESSASLTSQNSHKRRKDRRCRRSSLLSSMHLTYHPQQDRKQLFSVLREFNFWEGGKQRNDSANHFWQLGEARNGAFVRMNSFRKAHSVCAQLRNSLGAESGLRVKIACSPNDILWKNLSRSETALAARKHIGTVLTVALLTLWIVPMTAITAFLNLRSVMVVLGLFLEKSEIYFALPVLPLPFGTLMIAHYWKHKYKLHSDILEYSHCVALDKKMEEKNFLFGKSFQSFYSHPMLEEHAVAIDPSLFRWLAEREDVEELLDRPEAFDETSTTFDPSETPSKAFNGNIFSMFKSHVKDLSLGEKEVKHDDRKKGKYRSVFDIFSNLKIEESEVKGDTNQIDSRETSRNQNDSEKKHRQHSIRKVKEVEGDESDSATVLEHSSSNLSSILPHSRPRDQSEYHISHNIKK
eukprot:g539.t1